MNKVLYVHRTQGVGVEGVHIAGISGGFVSQGYGVDYLSPVITEKVDQLDGENRKPSRAHSLISRHLPEFLFEVMEILYNFKAVFEGLRNPAIKEYHFVYERYAIFSIVGHVVSRYSGCPLVLEVNYTSRSPLVRKRSTMLKPLAHWIDRWLFKRADVLLPVTGELRRQLIEEFGVESSKILVISNGCDLQTPANRNTSKQLSAVVTLGFVGGFYPWHGLGVLVSALKILHDKGHKISCVLIGDGPELPKIKEEVNMLGLSAVVQFAGKVPHNRLSEFFDEIDIGVLPDTNNYGSPMKLFEYMKFGIPFVAPDYGPVEEVTSDQGLIFAKQSPQGLAESIERLITNPLLYTQMSDKAKLLAETEYSWHSLSSRITNYLRLRGKKIKK